MKQFKKITLTLLIISANVLLLKAQNGNGNPPAHTQQGNVVVSYMFARQVSSNLGQISVRVSGNLSSEVSDLNVILQGPSIPGGSASVSMGSRLADPDGSQIFTSTFPINNAGLEGPTFLDVSVSGSAGYRTFYGEGRVFYHWGATVSTSNP